MDSVAIITNFEDKSETKHGTYQNVSTDTVELPFGSEEIDRLGKGTITLENIGVQNSMYVDI